MTLTPACVGPEMTNCILPDNTAINISARVVTGPPYGLQTFSVIAVARDGAGVRVTSSPDTEDAIVSPGRPQNLRFQ